MAKSDNYATWVDCCAQKHDQLPLEPVELAIEYLVAKDMSVEKFLERRENPSLTS